MRILAWLGLRGSGGICLVCIYMCQVKVVGDKAGERKWGTDGEDFGMPSQEFWFSSFRDYLLDLTW